jgi:hypothetical protein
MESALAAVKSQPSHLITCLLQLDCNLRRPLPLLRVYHYTAWLARDTRQGRAVRLHAHTARCRCTRIDGRKAFCNALLTSCPPLIPADVFYAQPTATARSDAEDAPRFPESNTVRVSHSGLLLPRAAAQCTCSHCFVCLFMH